MRKILIAFAALILVLIVVGESRANTIQLTSPSGLSASDTTLTYSGTIGSTASSPVIDLAGTNTLTFTDAGGTFEYDQANTDYFGTAFANGTNILFAGGFSGADAPITLTFANPVTEFGFNAEEYAFGPYTMSFTAFDGATDLGTFFAAGCDPATASSTSPPSCPSASGTLSFEGLQSTGGITSVVISDSDGDNIGLGPITFGSPTSTPEPSSLLLMLFGLALLGLMFLGRRHTAPR